MSKKTEKNSVIRPGDWVRVIQPLFLVRVGYPKTVDDYLDQVRKDQVLMYNLNVLLFRYSGDTGVWDGGDRSRQRLRIEREFAYFLAKKDGFSGNQRSLHFQEKPSYQDTSYKVLSVRSVYTGEYYPPVLSGGEDWDYEPGGIKNRKCHRVALLKFSKKKSLEIPVYYLQKE